MQDSAHKQNLLITDVGSFLGNCLAKKYLENNFVLYGSGKYQPRAEVLENTNFTYLDIDLSQPLLPHLPNFDLVIHLMAENQSADDGDARPKLSAISRRLIELSNAQKAKTFFLSRITASEHLAEIFASESPTKHPGLFLVGHIYGPGMDLHQKYSGANSSYFENNELVNLISQAVETDKIILENEGLDTIYPTFIDDAVEAIYRFTVEKVSKNIRFVTSQHATTALSAAYEIQNGARLNLQKELNLFFKGEEIIEKPKPQPVVRVQDLGISPKYSFAEGIEKTLIYFSSKDSNKKPNFQRVPESPPIIQSERQKAQTTLKNVNEKKQKIDLTKLKVKFPQVNSKLRATLLGLLIIVFLTSAKAMFDVYMGMNNLRNTQSSLKNADFEAAGKSAKKAQSSLKSARAETAVVTKPISFSKKIRGLNMGLESAEIGSSALVNFIDGSKILVQNLTSITSKDTSKTTLNLEDPIASLNKAYFESQRAYTLASLGARDSLFFKSKFRIAQEDFKNLSNISLTAQELLNLTPDLTGRSSKKNYLILLMNNTELRPGGGFIGNFGEVSFEDNKLKEIKVEDIYTIDGQLKEKITPPTQLTQKLGVDRLYLRDSNWTVDFSLNAKTARDFYKKETGKTVDGVIAIDLTLLENLLEKLGPIKLEDYNEEITAQNLFEKGEYYSEVGFFPGSTQKRDFFASLTTKLIAKIIEGTASEQISGGSPSYMALFETMAQGLGQKHIMLSFDNASINSFVKSRGWDNPLPPTAYDPADDSQSTRDFLSIAEANIGANKVNKYIKRKIEYDMTVGRDADLMATLTITYKNESPADTWPGGTYVNYLRLFIPKNSSLEKYLEDGKEVELEKPVGREVVSTVESTLVGELTQLATLVEVPVKAERSFTFKYRIPKNIKLEKAPTYALYISKQPGTDKDPFKFTFNLPAYLKIDQVDDDTEQKGKQNHTIETDLLVDRHFEVKISKK